ncbi:hypothetical protein [Streptomyces sp. NPDC017993]|uniref:hypothetical protein n=1 Tax=Streptomyces sp. NPDC017993 TaxID=3365027 RepID=UPI00378D511A
MSDDQRSADDNTPRPPPCDEERRLARKALAGRARNAEELSLLMDMLDLDPSQDARHEAARGHDAGRGGGRERRHESRRDTCRDARSWSPGPG